MILHVTVKQKIATYQKRDGDIVCGNGDYKVKFTFDEEWAAYDTKTARFTWNGAFFDKDFTGDTCDVPAIYNALECTVGVFAGDPDSPDIRTTTEAVIGCKKSARCGGAAPSTENNQYYANEAKQAAENAAADTIDEINQRIADGGIDTGTRIWHTTGAITDFYKTVDYQLTPGDLIPIEGKVVGVGDLIFDDYGWYLVVEELGYSADEEPISIFSRSAYNLNGKDAVNGSTIWLTHLALNTLTASQYGIITLVKGNWIPLNGYSFKAGDIVTDGKYYATVSGWTGDATNPDSVYISEPSTLGGENVVQTTGNSTHKVMSQKAVTDEFDEIREKVSSLNLFNSADEDVIDGAFLNAVGVVTEAKGYIITHKIYVQPNEQYVSKYTSAASLARIGCAFNEADEFVTTFSAQQSDDGAYVEFTIPNNDTISYIRLNYGSYEKDTIMVVKGTEYPTEYVPYIEPYSELRNSVRLGGEHIKQVQDGMNCETNPLTGKNISFNGDSICYGAGASGGYGKIIAERNGMTYQNIAQSGATIATGTTFSNGNNRHWICNTIADMDETADIVIVEGGVNDASLKVPLGALASIGSTYDTTTFYGAFEYMLSQLLKRFAGKKIGYIAVHKMVDGFLSRPIHSTGDTSYYDAAKACCEKWGVPFLDLNTTVPPWAFFTDARDAELAVLRNTYTLNGDGWHPNDEGYKKYYVPKIEAWLKTL